MLFFISAMVVSYGCTVFINLITDFKTPQSIFKFNHTEEIVDVVEGDESCMVVFRKDKNSYGQDYYLKSGDEYKSPYIFQQKKLPLQWVSMVFAVLIMLEEQMIIML